MANKSVAEIAQYNASFEEFYAAINASGTERFYQSVENMRILKEAIEATRLTWQEMWTKQMWQWAFSEKINELESRPVEVIEKEEGDRSVVNGRRNYASKAGALPPTQKEQNRLVGEALNQLTDAVLKKAEEEADEARGVSKDTSNPFNLKMRGTPDPSLPETDPKVQEFLSAMQKDNSKGSSQLLQNYLKARTDYKNTHVV